MDSARRRTFGKAWVAVAMRKPLAMPYEQNNLLDVKILLDVKLDVGKRRYQQQVGNATITTK